MQFAHRVAYVEARGLGIEDIAGKVVRHRCDNPPCINPDHLELGTVADNNRDMADRGRSTRGSASGNSKLTSEQVAEIRSRYVARCRINGGPALAREFGVGQQTISRIVNKKRWTHLGV
ncbi:MAG: HNH endonuclease [Alteromonas sp.]|nr:MAG: HNH endonuclease [Alteromonas sp.]